MKHTITYSTEHKMLKGNNALLGLSHIGSSPILVLGVSNPRLVLGVQNRFSSTNGAPPAPSLDQLQLDLVGRHSPNGYCTTTH